MNPEPPAALYRGAVMHARLRPVAHRFVYRIFALCLDLDRLDEAARLTPLLSIDRFNLVGFHPADHGDGGRTPLRRWVEERLAEVGVTGPIGRVRLLCQPRVLGFAFNPLSVHFAEDRAGRLVGLVYEVRNTFGERHAYAVAGGEAVHEIEKAFHVSPFMPAAAVYRFRTRPPAERASVHILERDAAGPLLAAGFAGERRALTTRAALAACLAVPLLGLKVVAAIRFEALRLWLKGLRLQGRPAPSCREESRLGESGGRSTSWPTRGGLAPAPCGEGRPGPLVHRR